MLSHADATGTSVLLGVMTAPHNARLRNQWREWRTLFNRTERPGGGRFDVRFVLGNQFYQSENVQGQKRWQKRQVVPQEPPKEIVREEDASHHDFVFVEGREMLPHVGKVTEKSAGWWLRIAEERPDYDFYC